MSAPAQWVLHVLMHPELDPDETKRVCAELRKIGGFKMTLCLAGKHTLPPKFNTTPTGKPICPSCRAEAKATRTKMRSRVAILSVLFREAEAEGRLDEFLARDWDFTDRAILNGIQSGGQA